MQYLIFITVASLILAWFLPQMDGSKPHGRMGQIFQVAVAAALNLVLWLIVWALS